MKNNANQAPSPEMLDKLQAQSNQTATSIVETSLTGNSCLGLDKPYRQKVFKILLNHQGLGIFDKTIWEQEELIDFIKNLNFNQIPYLNIQYTEL